MTSRRNLPASEFEQIVALAAKGRYTLVCPTKARARTVRGYFYTWRTRTGHGKGTVVSIEGRSLVFTPWTAVEGTLRGASNG